MGHKIHPHALRLGIIRTWESRWYATKRQFADLLHEDLAIRKHVKTNYASAAIARVEIERTVEKLKIIIHTARPGVLIGRRGAEIDKLREELQKLTKKQIAIENRDIKNPAIEAQLIADNIALQIVKRISHRRAMKKALSAGEAAGALGVKIMCAGRLGGSEMKRREWYRNGKIPLHTLRANIEYGFAEALTTYGLIGVKVWVYRGEVLPVRREREVVAAAPAEAPVPVAAPAGGV